MSKKVEQIEKLLSLVRHYPILYDMSHKKYKNTADKNKIWDYIGEQFQESGK